MRACVRARTCVFQCSDGSAGTKPTMQTHWCRTLLLLLLLLLVRRQGGGAGDGGGEEVDAVLHQVREQDEGIVLEIRRVCRGACV